ncbi:hypothetical protein BHC44_09795 [Snodgrassella alvi]|nr:hypothetical protein BHC44_09795 [Snodgrassella alvi]
MNINAKARFGGLFQFEVRKSGTDELVQKTGWMPNLVLDQGLDFMATGYWFKGCAVGTDGSKPYATQNGLGAQHAYKGSHDAGFYGVYNKDGVLYYWMRRRFRFAAGTFNKTTLAEVAILNNSGKCWNRALITDADGKQSTITLLSDEYLDVTCEVRCYLSLEDVNSTVNVVDKNNVTLMVLNTITRPGSVSMGSALAGSLDSPMNQWLQFNDAKLGKSELGDINSDVRGVYCSKVSIQPYVSGSHQCTADIEFGLDNANDTDFRVFSTGSRKFPSWQVGFSEPIRKTSSQAFIFRVTLSWGRFNAS